VRIATVAPAGRCPGRGALRRKKMMPIMIIMLIVVAEQ